MLNIVYLHCHDMGRYCSPYGHAIETPAIQRVAEEGVLFRHAHTVAPTCSPSRAGLLTGRYPHQVGMLGLAHRGWRLHDYAEHVVHPLKAQGYRTILAGTQHVANSTGVTPHDIGYDQVLDPHSQDEKRTQLATDFLRQNHDQPFFLDIGYFAPHRDGESFPKLVDMPNPNYLAVPPGLPDNATTRADMADYHASVTSFDLQVDQLMQVLDETGLSANTLVILTTDHGIAFPQHKCNLTDLGTGITLILRAPGLLPEGGLVDTQVTHLDVMPTVFDYAELEPVATWEGASMRPAIEGQTEPLHDAIFAEVTYHASYEPKRSVRTDRYRYIRRFGNRRAMVLPNTDNSPSKTWLHEAGWAHDDLPEESLHDLALDPGETVNLVDHPGHADALADLRQRLDDWMTRTNDPLQQGDVPLPDHQDAVTIDPSSYSPSGK